MGGVIEKELTYEGDTPEEIARMVDDDENKLLHYMMTRDKAGEHCFCFNGFMFAKDGLLTAQMTEGLI